MLYDNGPLPSPQRPRYQQPGFQQQPPMAPPRPSLPGPRPMNFNGNMQPGTGYAPSQPMGSWYDRNRVPYDPVGMQQPRQDMVGYGGGQQGGFGYGMQRQPPAPRYGRGRYRTLRSQTGMNQQRQNYFNPYF